MAREGVSRAAFPEDQSEGAWEAGVPDQSRMGLGAVFAVRFQRKVL